jgi:heme a synthase
MFLVLVMGATVTNTGSAEGCGRSWPLCNGQFVPEFTVSTAIEYSHRAVTGVEGVLVVALAAAMFTLRTRNEREVWIVGGLMLATLVLQAGLGAAAVLAPQSPFILATHFGISLAAFASTYLSAVIVYERTGGGRTAAPALAHRTALTVVAVYLLGVVYLGAYVRHAGISLACADWPLCNGQLVPALDGTTGFAFAHRVAAAVGVALVGWVAARVRGPAAMSAVILIVLQSLGGAAVVWTQVGLFSALAHAAIVALLFAVLAQMWRASLLSPERNDFVVNVYPLSDDAARRLQPPAAASAHPHVLATTSAPIGEPSGRSPMADHRRG